MCRDVRLWLGKYIQINKGLYYISKKIEVKSIKVQISIELKKILEYLFKNLFSSTFEKIEELTQRKEFEKSPGQKFKQAVMLVIRNNRKLKRVVKRKSVYVKCMNIEIGLRTSSQLLLLTTQTPSTLVFEKKYHPSDRYLIDPENIINFHMKKLEVWVSN